MTLGTVARLLLASLRCRPRGELHVFLCVCDHHEPDWGGAPKHVRRERVNRWVREYPANFADLADSRGRPPQHTFFYPAEVYDPWEVETLAELCRAGFGEFEIHLHHDNDSAENLRETLETHKRRLFDEHGLLAKDENGEITYGFIHGNWALNNCRPDGRWCGVEGELTVLRETGCYADFTFPSAPSPTQPRTVNSIYYAIDDPRNPRAHEGGVRAKVGQPPPKDGLLMIQGPLALDWNRRRYGVIPGVENADVHGQFPATVSRFDAWLRARVTVEGRPDWLFVKLHTHGSHEKNAGTWLGEPMRRFHEELATISSEREPLHLHYVTAREAAQLVHDAELGACEPFAVTRNNTASLHQPVTSATR